MKINEEVTDFRTTKIPKADPDYIWWLVIIIDSVLKNYEKYYPQVFLKECKYSDIEKKVIKYLTDDLKLIENSVYHASNVHFIYIYIYI